MRARWRICAAQEFCRHGLRQEMKRATRWLIIGLTLVPMLLAGQSISPDARQALRENRLEDFAQLLMREYGLTRAETNVLNCACRLQARPRLPDGCLHLNSLLRVR